MTRDELSNLTVAELRALGRKRGLTGMSDLRKDALVERLATGSTAVKERPRAKRPEPKARTTAAKNSRGGGSRKGTSPGGPLSREVETETMARLYEEQGHFGKALEIYAKLLALDPTREDLKAKMDSLRTREATPKPAPVPSRGEPTSMLDYEELPDSYGENEVALLVQDPWWLFVYWEVSGDGKAGARAQLGGEAHAARLVLRLQTVYAEGGDVRTESRDLEVDWDHGRRYLEAPRPGVRVSAAVGLRAPSGAFAPIAHSAPILVPFDEPGSEAPVEWMDVAPARTRGKEREAITVRARGKEIIGRGRGAGWEGGLYRHPGGRAPLPDELVEPLESAAERGPGSHFRRWPGGASEQSGGARGLRSGRGVG